MPDILKITTPLISKPEAMGNRQLPDPSAPFDLRDVQKVIQTNPQTELLKQNNGMIQKEDAPVLLMNLLKDPSVTAGFLKNIFLMQEIIQLLPVNNSPVTQEIEQLFQALLISPEEIVPEMRRQEDTSTVFRGELFNFLRELTAKPTTPALRGAVSSLLKSINGYLGNRDVLDALANTLQFLGRSLEPSKELSGRLLALSARFREEQAPEQFRALKQETLGLLREVKDSILFSPKLDKVSSITVYNLSRYNDSPDFLQESIHALAAQLNQRQRSAFHRAVGEFFSDTKALEEVKSAGIMDVLTQILGHEAGEDSARLMNSGKIEKIIHSLLSSPCNFTPLLHYVVPVQYQEIKAFAEIWINPKGQEDERGREPGERDIHVLAVFEIEGMGQFETELYVRDKLIDLSLFCPPPYAAEFGRRMRPALARCVEGLPYRMGNITIEKLERTRSLMDVFHSLPYKRTGVNVKI